jgi:hypothetical protein
MKTASRRLGEGHARIQHFKDFRINPVDIALSPFARGEEEVVTQL